MTDASEALLAKILSHVYVDLVSDETDPDDPGYMVIDGDVGLTIEDRALVEKLLPVEKP